MGEPGEGTNKGYEIGVGDTARFGVSHLLLPLQSVLQKVIENTEHKAIMLDPETQSKVRGAGKAPQSNASMGGFYGIPLQSVLTPSFLAFHPLLQIHQVHEMLQRWDPVVSSLPDVVQRLLTLRDLHEEGEGLGEMLGAVVWHDKEHAGGGGVQSPAALSFYLPPSYVVHAGPGILGDHAAGDGC